MSKKDSLEIRAARALERLQRNYPKHMGIVRKRGRQSSLTEKEFLTEQDKQTLQLIYSARQRARKNNLPCTISLTDIQIPSHCPALGIPLERGTSIIWDNSPTLDRLDPSKGYVPSNVAVISMRANRIKNNGTADEIIAVGNWLREALAK